MAGPVFPTSITPTNRAALRAILARLKRNAVILEGDAEDLENAVYESGTAGENLSAGEIVRQHTDGNIYLAQADSDANSKVVGFVVADASSGNAVLYQVAGLMSMTGWGLTARSFYYLSAGTAGLLTATAPSITGQYVVPVAFAHDSDTIDIRLNSRILL